MAWAHPYFQFSNGSNTTSARKLRDLRSGSASAPTLRSHALRPAPQDRTMAILALGRTCGNTKAEVEAPVAWKVPAPERGAAEVSRGEPATAAAHSERTR